MASALEPFGLTPVFAPAKICRQSGLRTGARAPSNREMARMLFRGIFVVFCFVAPGAAAPVLAGDFVDSCESMYVGDTCKYPIKDLGPTQFAVGFREVGRKLKKMEKMSHDELRDFLVKNAAPVVLAPGGKYYIIDHHHETRAAFELGRENVFITLHRDYSKLSSMKEFWKRMIKNKLVYLYDESGKGPRTPDELPKHVRYLKDDPYRSLAAEVRRQGGFLKTKTPFAEFYWGNFFRSRGVKIGSGGADFDQAVARALELTKSPDAKNLPGYIGSGGKSGACFRYLISREPQTSVLTA